MRTIIVVPLLALLGAPGSALADAHLVSPNEVKARLSAANAADLEARAALDRLLSCPGARSAATRLGADVDRLRAGVAALDGGEVRDLAARAAALGVDPAAGHRWDSNDFLIVFLVVAIVILVLSAV
jgi:hypothetical protein